MTKEFENLLELLKSDVLENINTMGSFFNKI